MHRHTPRDRAARAALLVLALLLTGAAASCSSSSDGAASATAPTTTAASRPAAKTDAAATASTTTAAATAASAGPIPKPGEVIKDILGTDVAPPGAPDRTLTLIVYRIGAGAKLAPHIHPGVQMARIRAGRLSYTIVKGTAVVRRAGSTTDEQITGPTTITLRPGDTVTEVDGMVHFGANDTKLPVIIEATLLTETGKDLAVPVPVA